MWSKLKAGDKVCLKHGTTLIDTEVSTVGRKYITVVFREYKDKLRFEMDNRHNYLPNISRYASLYRLYRTREEAEYALNLQINKERLRILISELTHSNLSLESLIKLNNTLKEILHGRE